MKVILRSDVKGIGKRGDVVSVADGHARNYLLPHGHAIAASDGAVNQAAAMRKARDAKERASREAALGVASRLGSAAIAVVAKAGNEGRLFGSVTAPDLAKAIKVSLTTTGKAILFTATIMLIGIIPWYFLSDLKFMADMGMLLVAIMLINMVLSLVVLPLIVWFLNPGFLRRTDLAIGENIDLSQFTTANEPH